MTILWEMQLSPFSTATLDPITIIALELFQEVVMVGLSEVLRQLFGTLQRPNKILIQIPCLLVAGDGSLHKMWIRYGRSTLNKSNQTYLSILSRRRKMPCSLIILDKESPITRSSA